MGFRTPLVVKPKI
jgi:hypothetical protein